MDSPRKKQRDLIRKLEKALFQTENKEELQKIIHYFSKRKTPLSYHQLGPCLNCESEYGQKLNCKHYMCHDCLEQQLLIQGKGTILKHNLDYMVCGCKEKINESLALEIYRAKPPIFKKQKPEPIKTILSCPICMGEYSVEEIVTLECDHKFCKNCVQMYIQTKVEEGKTQLEHYPCPTGLCESEAFTEHIILEQLSQELKEKYYHFTLGNLANDENEDQIYKVCPRCESGAFIPKNLSEVYCGKPGCTYRFCTKCFQNYHHPLTCEQFQEKEKKIAQKNLKGLRRIRSCPVCKVSIEKNGGCKYIACKSSYCQGKTFFCFSCGELLKSKHEMHNCPDPREPISNRCGIF